MTEFPPIADAVAIESLEVRPERRELGQCHNRLERKRGTMGGMSISDAAYRMAEDLVGRLGHMLIVQSRLAPQVFGEVGS